MPCEIYIKLPTKGVTIMKFIKVHDFETNSLILVPLNGIQGVWTDKSTVTFICMHSCYRLGHWHNDGFFVRETLAEVYELINA